MLVFMGSYIGRFAEISVTGGYIPFYFRKGCRYIYHKVLIKKVGKQTIFNSGVIQYRDTEIGNNGSVEFLSDSSG
jgi:hypothetical protein